MRHEPKKPKSNPGVQEQLVIKNSLRSAYGMIGTERGSNAQSRCTRRDIMLVLLNNCTM